MTFQPHQVEDATLKPVSSVDSTEVSGEAGALGADCVTGLVARLREAGWGHGDLYDEAADEIERLASAQAPATPDGSWLALNLAIQALSVAPPEGDEWPVNWRAIVYGLKRIQERLPEHALMMSAGTDDPRDEIEARQRRIEGA